MPAFIVVGLGYGDEGKGVTVDHLVRQHKASGVVRFNGGAQAAHNVVLPDGRHHTFSQFGAGTLAGAATILSKHTLVNPHALFVEWEKLRELGYWPLGKISVQRGALVTTPYHVAANRLREFLRGQNRHGSCGMGIGETVALQRQGLELRVEDLRNPKLTRRKLMDIRDHFQRELVPSIVERGINAHHLTAPLFKTGVVEEALEVYRVFVKAVPMIEALEFDADEHVVFEGAQGVLLDQFYGFHPHTTWSDVTPANAREQLAGYAGEIRTVGVIRSYMTRHGAGPFVTEDPALAARFPEAHNDHGAWQGAWRVGWTDLAALDYALDAIGGVDDLAVTHLDRVEGDWKICLGYGGARFGAPHALKDNRQRWEAERKLALERLSAADIQWAEHVNMTPDRLLEVIEAHTGQKATIRSYGPTHEEVRDGTPATPTLV